MVNRLFQRGGDGLVPPTKRIRWLAWGLLAVVVVLSAAAVFFSARSDQSSSEAKKAAVAAKRTVEEVQRIGREQACRSEFSAAVTDGNTKVATLSDELDTIRFDVEVAGLVNRDEAAVQAGVARGQQVKAEKDASVKTRATANAEYQALIDAQRHNRPVFDRMCQRGPAS